jgi:predicted hydrocarbon binding protein
MLVTRFEDVDRMKLGKSTVVQCCGYGNPVCSLRGGHFTECMSMSLDKNLNFEDTASSYNRATTQLWTSSAT